MLRVPPNSGMNCPSLMAHPPTLPALPACAPQLHMPGMSTSASFDDLLHQLIAAEGGLPSSL